jgi:CheY-like chemotaxis protein
LLESIGCQVAGFTDPRTALSAFRKQADVFDLVVTDQIMPELTGTELARDLLKLRPDLPMILCTGRGDDLDAHVALDLGIRKYLLKPVPLAELARAVGELLEIGRSARVG